MAHLLGIDLGTTTTIVARIGADGAPELVRDWEGEPITPTAVAFETVNHVVVGREARAMAEDGEHVFLEFKRDLGTGVSHPVFGRRVTPLDLSALMLRKVREHAEAAHGPVDLAVITIPANFTNAAREATLEAARRAGFGAVHMINEPTAAALAYARGQRQPLAGLDRAELAGVFLAGGTCRVPAVRAAVARVFGREPLLRDPDTAVALGAALYAAHKADPAKLSPGQRRQAAAIAFQDIAPHYYGTLSVDDDGLLENSIIIAKGEKLPVSRTRTYYTVEDDQRVLTCEVTQSAIPESDPTLVLRIAEVEMPLPPGRPADQPIEVTFAYDLNGIMRAEFRDLGTGKPLVIELRDNGAGRGSLNVAKVDLG